MQPVLNYSNILSLLKSFPTSKLHKKREDRGRPSTRKKSSKNSILQLLGGFFPVTYFLRSNLPFEPKPTLILASDVYL